MLLRLQLFPLKINLMMISITGLSEKVKTLEIKFDSAVEAEKKQEKVDVEGILFKLYCILIPFKVIFKQDSCPYYISTSAFFSLKLRNI